MVGLCAGRNRACATRLVRRATGGNAPMGRQRPSHLTNDSRCRCRSGSPGRPTSSPGGCKSFRGSHNDRVLAAAGGEPPGLLASTLLAPRASETHPGRIPGAFYRRSRNATAISTPTTSTTAPAPRSRRGSWSAAYRGTVPYPAAFASSVAPDPSQSERPHELHLEGWHRLSPYDVPSQKVPSGDEDAVHVVAVWISFLQ